MSCSQTISSVEFIPTCAPIMSESSRVPNSFLVPVRWNNPLHLTYNEDVPMHPNEEFDYKGSCNAPFVTLPSFSVLEYLERNQTCFNAGRFRHVPTDGNELQVGDRLGERHDTAVTGWDNTGIIGVVAMSLASVLWSKR